MTFAGLTLTQIGTLLGALGGATLLLYLLKLRRKRVEVPFSPLWARVVEERKSSALFSTFKRFFSFLVQFAILAAIVIALGDPQMGNMAGCHYEKAPPPPERHTLIILDGSASMAAIEEGETRVERARTKAHEIIASFGDNPNHKAMVVQMDGRVRPLSLWTSNRKALKGAIDAYAGQGALDTPTNVKETLALARSALKGKLNAKTVWITDRAFSPLSKEDAAAIKLEAITIGSEGVNVGIEAFNVRPYLDDSLSYAIFYGLRNDSDKPLKATLYLYANEVGQSPSDFTQDSHLAGAYSLVLPPRQVTHQVIENVSFAGSRLAAKVEIASEEPVRDIFPRDDVAFALVPERKKLKVQLVTTGNLFLHATLFVRENVNFEVVKPGAYQGPDGYDITVVDGVDVDMSRPGSYFVINPQPGETFKIKGTLKEPEPRRTRKRHPIARGLTFVDLNIAEASKIKKVRGDVTVVGAQGGTPLVFTRVDRPGNRRFAVLSFDVRQSLLPLNYTFPLMVVNVFNWFYQEEDALLQPNRAGVELSVPLALSGKKLAVKTPTAAHPVNARRIADRVHFSADRIGIYELSTETSEDIQAIAINLMDEAESQMKPRGDYPAWTPPPLYVKKVDPWLDHLWRVLLLIALGILTVEWFTYHRRWTV